MTSAPWIASSPESENIPELIPTFRDRAGNINHHSCKPGAGRGDPEGQLHVVDICRSSFSQPQFGPTLTNAFFIDDLLR